MQDSNPNDQQSLTNYNAFDPDGPFIAIFAAPRKSGKSFLINKLLTESPLLKRFDSLIIASPSLEFKDEYPLEEKFNGVLIKIKNNFRTQISQLIDEVKHANKLHFEKPDKYEPHHCLIILDDIIDSKLAAYRSSENITDELAERGRHFNVSLIASAQFLSAISPSVRRNSTYLFLWSPSNYADTERILQEYVPREAKKEFLLLLQRAFMKKFAFVMINNDQECRTHYKKRFYRGFTQHLFPFKAEELDLKHLNADSKKRAREDNSSSEEEEDTKVEE